MENIDDMTIREIKEVLAQREKNNKPVFFDVPENITLDFGGNILFNYGRQRLWVDKISHDSTYDVFSFQIQKDSFTTDFVLVPCEREDLKCDDTAYRTNKDENDFLDTRGYCKILNEKEHAYVVDRHVFVGSGYKWLYWYKVVKRSEVLDYESLL